MKFNPRLRCIDSFGIEQVTRAFYDGHDYLERNPNQSILEAKKMLESTIKYIYQSINGDAEEIKNFSLNKQINTVLRTLYTNDEQKLDSITKMISSFSTFSLGLSELRNASGTGHGNAPGLDVPFEQYEALYIMRSSEDICIFLLDKLESLNLSSQYNILYSKFIHTNEFEMIENQIYVNQQRNITYILADGIITQVEIEFSKMPLDIYMDSELINDHIFDYMEKDSIQEAKKSENNYIYKSEKKVLCIMLHIILLKRIK
ncbi:abortive infection family protein [Bacillus cereus group sp. BY32LC]|uniref:abortive infection family protein n=1 Tax=Bacillus cereus group sp. BY32LC TaxID=3018079 RepID=UPI0022E52729|nr:abortive infection family protein [Bacillus cereus group sp. BY32LC]MDA1806762.1 abortive infection family protein [Bacillus cereus group sp. BY32LC]